MTLRSSLSFFKKRETEMLVQFQKTLAHDINGIANVWLKYAAWFAYWMAHAAALLVLWSLKLTIGAAYHLTVGPILNPPQKKKKKKGH